MKIARILLLFLMHNIVYGDMFKLAPWQRVYSSYVERCEVAGVEKPPLAFSVNVFTGMTVLSVYTSAVVEVGVTNILVSTNYGFGETNIVISNWTSSGYFIPTESHEEVIVSAITSYPDQTECCLGTNISISYSTNTVTIWEGFTNHVSVAWERPIPLALLKSWDGAMYDAVPNFCDPLTNQAEYLANQIGVSTSYVSEWWMESDTQTNFAPVYPSSPLMLTVSNWLIRTKLGTDFNYTPYDTNVLASYAHDFRICIQETQDMVEILGSTTIGIVSTSEVGGVTYYTLGFKPFVKGYKIPIAYLDYPKRTNAFPFFRVVVANTNVNPDTAVDCWFRLQGTEAWLRTNNSPTTNSTFDILKPVNGAHVEHAPLFEINYFEPYTGWSKTETNGQTDSLIGTTIEIIWSNRAALYYAPTNFSWTGGVEDDLPAIYASSNLCSLRYSAATCLVSTFKSSPCLTNATVWSHRYFDLSGGYSRHWADAHGECPGWNLESGVDIDYTDHDQYDFSDDDILAQYSSRCLTVDEIGAVEYIERAERKTYYSFENNFYCPGQTMYGDDRTYEVWQDSRASVADSFCNNLSTTHSASIEFYERNLCPYPLIVTNIWTYFDCDGITKTNLTVFDVGSLVDHKTWTRTGVGTKLLGDSTTPLFHLVYTLPDVPQLPVMELTCSTNADSSGYSSYEKHSRRQFSFTPQDPIYIFTWDFQYK